jgi:hypothetical protein
MTISPLIATQVLFYLMIQNLEVHSAAAARLRHMILNQAVITLTTHVPERLGIPLQSRIQQEQQPAPTFLSSPHAQQGIFRRVLLTVPNVRLLLHSGGTRQE